MYITRAYSDGSIVGWRISGFCGRVGTHGDIGLARILRILHKGAAGAHLISLFKLNLEVLLKIFIPKDDIVGLLGLVHGKGLNICIYLFGLTVVCEHRLSGSQLVFVVEVVVSFKFPIVRERPKVFGTIVVKLLLVRGAPKNGTTVSLLVLISL